MRSFAEVESQVAIGEMFANAATLAAYGVSGWGWGDFLRLLCIGGYRINSMAVLRNWKRLHGTNGDEACDFGVLDFGVHTQDSFSEVIGDPKIMVIFLPKPVVWEIENTLNALW